MIKGVKKKIYSKQEILTDSQKDAVDEESMSNKNNRSNTKKLNICNNNKENKNSGNTPLSIKLTNQNLMEAVIYSEILGKPRCKRRGRWR